MWLFGFAAWVDVMWDLEFTERKPLDDAIEEELAASGEKAFRTLYQCLLVHAADQQQSAGRDGASTVKLIRHRFTLSLVPGSTQTRLILSLPTKLKVICMYFCCLFSESSCKHLHWFYHNFTVCPQLNFLPLFHANPWSIWVWLFVIIWNTLGQFQWLMSWFWQTSLSFLHTWGEEKLRCREWERWIV